MVLTSFIEPDLPQASHVRVRYRSKTVLPVEVGPLDAPTYDMRTAILPAAEEGDASLPILRSPSWNPFRHGVELTVYWREGEPPDIFGIAPESRATFFRKFAAILSHAFFPEPFGSSSVNYLLGYHIAGIRLTVLLGIFFILWIAVLSIRNRSLSPRIAAFPCLAFLLLSSGRFAVDSALATARDLREVRSERTYGELGSTPFMGTEVARSRTEDLNVPLLLFACTRLVTPLTYFAHPIEVTARKEAWPQATRAVLTNIWDEEQTSFSCNGRSRSGSILRLFDNGDALVQLQ